MKRHRVVRVPASSANLGPGYDTMAAALGIHLELEVEETGELTVEAGGGELPSDRTNLCVRAFESLHSADGISFRIRSEIPVSAGLGSSAAAIVAGLVAADHMFELDAPLFNLADELEGHPDNVGAALYGAIVICADGPAAAIDAAPASEAELAIPPAQGALLPPLDGARRERARAGCRRRVDLRRRPGRDVLVPLAADRHADREPARRRAGLQDPAGAAVAGRGGRAGAVAP